MCRDHVRVYVGACGKPSSPLEARCQVKALVGTDGKPNGNRRCPSRWMCIGGAGKV
jgi:hypothetical protein